MCGVGSEIKINQKTNKVGSVADGDHKIYLVSPQCILNSSKIITKLSRIVKTISNHHKTVKNCDRQAKNHQEIVKNCVTCGKMLFKDL